MRDRECVCTFIAEVVLCGSSDGDFLRVEEFSCSVRSVEKEESYFGILEYI